jgi:hypothetical protein
MRTPVLLAAIAIMCAPVMDTNPARAQNSVSFVSGTGSDSNPCTRLLPCQTFQRAHDQTNSGGFVSCVDAGRFDTGTSSPMTISKSITIDCTNTFAAILAPTAGTAISINTSGIVVILRGLTIAGLGVAATGVQFTQGSALQVENCKFHGFQANAAQALRFVPNTPAQLYVSDSVFSQNGVGILVQSGPAGATALVSLQRVQLENNGTGYRADNAAGGGSFTSIVDSVAASNTGDGFTAISFGGSQPVIFDIQRSASNINFGSGIVANGTTASVFIGSTMATANTVGFSQLNGGVIRSYGNNSVDNNPGTVTPPTLPQL